MNYRKAKIKDVSTIKKIAIRQSLFPYPTLIYATLACMGYLHIVEENDEIVGFICFCPMPLSADAFILQICLKDTYQSKGLGKQILSKLCQTLRKQFKITQVWAHTLKERSLKFFKRQKWNPMLSIFNITLIRKNLDPHRQDPQYPDPQYQDQDPQ